MEPVPCRLCGRLVPGAPGGCGPCLDAIIADMDAFTERTNRRCDVAEHELREAARLLEAYRARWHPEIPPLEASFSIP